LRWKGVVYDLVMAPLERLGLARRRGAFLAGLEGPVLELGAGTGLNLPRYSSSAAVIAIDPQLSMLEKAKGRRRAGQCLVCARAEALPFPEAVFPAVAGSFVFCTVQDPLRGLAEARRVLAPEGELRLLEHVRWDRHPRLARLQDFLTPTWRIAADGCHLNRDIGALLERAGFRITRRRDDADGLVVELSARRS
jgi:ubiquinone/menaquinone biosynthesis C-methylase UbiE